MKRLNSRRLRSQPSWRVLLLLVTLALTCSLSALAETTGPRVVLVTNHADASIMPLLRAELVALGFDVSVTNKGEEEIISTDLPKAARSEDAVAAFRVVVAKGTVELWVADRVTGKVVLREIMVQDTASTADETMVVLQAVELLRASLMEIDADHPPRGEVEASPELKELAGVPKARGTHLVELGAGALWLSPEFGVFPMMQLGYRIRVAKRLRIGGMIASSLGQQQVHAEEGSAGAEPRFFGASGSYSFAQGLFRPTVGLDVGLEWIHLTSDAAGDRPSNDDDAFLPFAQLSAGLAVAPSRSIQFFLRAVGGVAIQPPTILFDGREVASFAPVYVGGQAGLAFVLP